MSEKSIVKISWLDLEETLKNSAKIAGKIQKITLVKPKMIHLEIESE